MQITKEDVTKMLELQMMYAELYHRLPIIGIDADGVSLTQAGMVQLIEVYKDEVREFAVRLIKDSFPEKYKVTFEIDGVAFDTAGHTHQSWVDAGLNFPAIGEDEKGPFWKRRGRSEYEEGQ